MKKKLVLKYIIYIMLIVAISFVLPRIIPGSPLSYHQTDTYILNLSLPEETFNAFYDYYAPDKSLLEQFKIYLGHLANLDLGYSFYYRLPVTSLIKSRLPWTMLLGGLSLLISTFVGLLWGVKTGINGRYSKIKLTFFIGIQAMPAFLVAVFIQGILGYKLKLFPAWGAYSAGVTFFTSEFYWDVVLHIVLPLLTLVLCEIPGIYLIAYNSTKKIKNENFVQMGRYLNISKAEINSKFIFKNILPEVMGKLNIQVIYAITGSLFVEATFSYPGLGQLLRNAAASRDFPLMQGLLLLICFYGLIVNAIFEFIIHRNNKSY